MTRQPIPRAALLLTTALLANGVARADDSFIEHLNNHLEGGIGAEHLGYREISSVDTPEIPPGGQLDTENGTILGSRLSFAWQGKLWFIDKLQAGFDAHLSTGRADYNGYLIDLQSNTLSPLQASTSEMFTDLQFKIGKGFGILPGGRDQLTPYVGIGLTAWHRDLGGAPGGYTEQYRHKFWKAGGQYQIEVMKDLALSLDASYGRMFDARMNSSDLPTNFDLGSTSIQSYTLGLRYATSPEAYVGLDTYWMHYGYGQSPVYAVTLDGESGTVVEPTSRTTRDGLQLVFGYAYR